MKEAVQQYLEREEAREQMHQDALAAWRNYEETGLHVTGEEMDAWAAKLEKDPTRRPGAARHGRERS